MLVIGAEFDRRVGYGPIRTIIRGCGILGADEVDALTRGGVPSCVRGKRNRLQVILQYAPTGLLPPTPEVLFWVRRVSYDISGKSGMMS